MLALNFSCFNVAIGIVVGAAGGHKPWQPETKQLFDRAQMFHFLCAIGMLVASQPTVASMFTTTPGLPFWLLQNGILSFCVPLYLKAFHQ